MYLDGQQYFCYCWVFFIPFAAPVEKILLYTAYTPARRYYTVVQVVFTTTCVIDFHALLMSNFEHRILRIEPTTVCTKACSRGLNLHHDKKS